MYASLCKQCSSKDGWDEKPIVITGKTRSIILCLTPRTTVTSLEHAQGYTLQDASYASIPVFLFEGVRKHTSCERIDERLPLESALTSQSFSR